MAVKENISTNLPKVIQNLKVTKGKMQNVLHAALQEYADAVKDHVERTSPVDTGTYKAGWELEEHGKLDISIVNDVDYANYVWVQPKYGGDGQTGIWVLQIKRAETFVDKNFDQTLSDAIKKLLDV